MLCSVNIENFRCFKSVSVNNLKSITVLVGKNGRGKTTFLEALFLAGGMSPEILFRTRNWRGGGGELKLNAETYDSFWRQNFYNFDVSAEANISFIDSTARKRQVRMSYKANEALELPLAEQKSNASTFSVKAVNFEWTGFSGKKHNCKVEFKPEGLKLTPFEESYSMVFLNPASLLSPDHNAGRFNELVIANRESEALVAVQKLFPEVQGLSMGIDAGSNTILAALRNLKEKLPITSVSAGISKYLAILLAIYTKKKGAVLVDQIEDGLYFDQMGDIWASLLEACKANEVQLIVTTHSSECLSALLPTLEKNSDDFSLLRSIKDNGECKIRQFSGAQFRDALSEDAEVR